MASRIRFHQRVQNVVGVACHQEDASRWRSTHHDCRKDEVSERIAVLAIATVALRLPIRNRRYRQTTSASIKFQPEARVGPKFGVSDKKLDVRKLPIVFPFLIQAANRIRLMPANPQPNKRITIDVGSGTAVDVTVSVESWRCHQD